LGMAASPFTRLMKSLLWLVLIGSALAADSVPWSTLDSGGGSSATVTPGGVSYTLSGTVGQFDAAPSASGGPWTFRGGFWVEVVPSSPSSTALQIVVYGQGNGSLQWTDEAAGAHIQV